MPKKLIDFQYPANVRFQCMKCALCCGDSPTKSRHIIMTNEEAEEISKTTMCPSENFACRTKGHRPYEYEMKKNRNGTCVFLDGLSCTVYAFRPLVCRFYPFELKPGEIGEYIFSFTDECPGIGKGKRLTHKKFQELIDEASNRLC